MPTIPHRAAGHKRKRDKAISLVPLIIYERLVTEICAPVFLRLCAYVSKIERLCLLGYERHSVACYHQLLVCWYDNDFHT